MYNKHLDTFITVAEMGSFSKAAELLFISRTAIVQQMNLLEEHLGFPVLVRDNRGVKLTLAGELVYERAKKLKEISAATISECLALQNTKQIRIGILPNLPLTILTPACMEFHRKFPDIKITFVERSASEYLQAFLNHEFDISADYMSKLVSANQDFSFMKLMTDHFDCAVSPVSPLAKKKKITLDDLAGRKVSLFMANVASAEDKLRSILTKSGKNIEIVDIESYKQSLPMTCVMEDSLLLHYHTNAAIYEPLVSIPLSLNQDCKIDLGFCYRHDASLEVLHFLTFVKSYVEKQTY